MVSLSLSLSFSRTVHKIVVVVSVVCVVVVVVDCERTKRLLHRHIAIVYVNDNKQVTKNIIPPLWPIHFPFRKIQQS